MRLKTGMSIAVIAACLGGAGVSSPETGDRILSESEIREITSGKTFHYTLEGQPRGDEQHYEDGRVTWRLPEGECLHGVWMVEGEVLCYFYGINSYGCWNVVANASSGTTTFRHTSVDLDGTRNDSPSVYINRISEEPVSCAPPQLVNYSPR